MEAKRINAIVLKVTPTIATGFHQNAHFSTATSLLRFCHKILKIFPQQKRQTRKTKIHEKAKGGRFTTFQSKNSQQ